MHLIPPRSEGFTLIELSIVLVIIGLLIGGIFGGQIMIENAEKQFVLKQIREYGAAKNLFRLKYGALPGDIANVTQYELHLSPTTGLNNTCYTVAATSFNGDGDGFLEDNGNSSEVYFNGESANFFIHLSNAGLIEDALGSEDRPCSVAATKNARFPESKLGNSVAALQHKRNIWFLVGGFGDSISGNIAAAVDGDLLTPMEAYYIDNKSDDGEPTEGMVKVITAYPVATSSANNHGEFTIDATDNATNCVYNAAYNGTLETPACSIIMRSD